MIPSYFNLDIEPTNRCNARCSFCPRDQTPHQGLMTPEVFDRTLERAIEFREVAAREFGYELRVNLCGLGEPLLNRHTPSFVEALRHAGFPCALSTNGALLDETRARRLLDAGLQGIDINVGDEGADYDDVYRLPFERTLENVLRFKEMAGDDCVVQIVLVDHRRDPDHVTHMTEFWRSHGISRFLPFPIMNRGGALFVDEMQYGSYPELAEARRLLEAHAEVPTCVAPFIFLFVGYDGQHYLCCSDWKKEAPLGSVFDRSFVDVVADKMRHVASREPVCRTCNHDPVNRMTDALRARTEGEVTDVDAVLDDLVGNIAFAQEASRRLDPEGTDAALRGGAGTPRRLIPVRTS